MLSWSPRWSAVMAVVEASMDSDPGSQATGPSGLLAERVGNHAASAHRLIEQSQQLIARVKDRIHHTDRLVERTFRWVGDAAGVARVAERSAAGAVERCLWAKERELAAHERAIQRHDEAAALQERFGHPDRAASAREHGRQARALHAQALRELQDWAGSAAAAED